ncbi:MAG: HAD family hydrolase [Candidatus Andersenbacteria bacterium]|nr:HAD family hydrolase [Candidatus Andersenbacteria bacterium]
MIRTPMRGLSNPKVRVIFLDRDGTINRADKGEFVFRVKDWQWLPGAEDALKRLQAAGYSLAVVTNQSGIGHGLYSEADMQAVNEHMAAQLAASGVSLAAVVSCPHRRDAGCGCRKPATGLARQIEGAMGPINYAASWAVGDKPSDVGFGRALGARTALLRSRHWREEQLAERPDAIVDSLREAADIIVSSK